MAHPPTSSDNHPLENLLRLALITLGLVVVIFMVVICLPARSSAGMGWRGALASLTQGFRGFSPASLVSSKQFSGRVSYVSYNDPRVRRTLDLPWAKN